MENSIPSDDRLDQLRKKMTSVTSLLIEVLNERGIIAQKIAEEKQRRGINQIRDLRREAEALVYSEQVNQGPFSNDAVRRVVQVAMDVSSELQATVTDLPIGESS